MLQAAVEIVKPGGTGRPALVISARPEPFPPSTSFIVRSPSALPFANAYTYFFTAFCTALGAFAVTVFFTGFGAGQAAFTLFTVFAVFLAIAALTPSMVMTM